MFQTLRNLFGNQPQQQPPQEESGEFTTKYKVFRYFIDYGAWGPLFLNPEAHPLYFQTYHEREFVAPHGQSAFTAFVTEELAYNYAMTLPNQLTCAVFEIRSSEILHGTGTMPAPATCTREEIEQFWSLYQEMVAAFEQGLSTMNEIAARIGESYATPVPDGTVLVPSFTMVRDTYISPWLLGVLSGDE